MGGDSLSPCILSCLYVLHDILVSSVLSLPPLIKDLGFSWARVYLLQTTPHRSGPAFFHPVRSKSFRTGIKTKEWESLGALFQTQTVLKIKTTVTC